MPARHSLTLWLGRSVLAAGSLVALVAPLALGYFTSRLNFTYGTQGLDPAARGRAALMIAVWIVAGIVFDAVCRRGLLAWLRARLPIAAAVALHLVVLNVAFAPILFWYDMRTDILSVWEMVLYENLLQVLFTAIYLAFGSFVLSGCLQGLFAALRFTLINDVSGPFETLFFYSYSGEAVGWALTLSPILGSIWIGIVSRVFGLGAARTAPAGTARRRRP